MNEEIIQQLVVEMQELFTEGIKSIYTQILKKYAKICYNMTCNYY